MSDALAYRPVPDDRVADYQRFLDYAFRPTASVDLPDSVDDLPPQARVSDRRGLFADAELRAICGQFWLSLRVRGDYRGVGGLAEVATLPEHRHEGYVSRLVRESLVEYSERDLAFSALWPFEYPFYRKYGWACASRHARTTVDPAALAAIADGREGEFVRLDADRWTELARVYERTNDRPLAMDRTETWWRDRTLRDWGDDPHVYGVEREGDLVGYAVYDFADGEAGRRLDVQEFGYVDHAAFRDLLRFCYYHDAQVESVRIHGPIEEAARLQDVLAAPDGLDFEVRPGPMVRVVDVPAALEAIAYPTGGTVTLGVTDPVVDANDRTFELRVADETVRCDPVDGRPDVECDVGTLAQVVTGHRSVGDCAAASDLVGETETLSTLLPPVDAQPYLREWF